MRGTAFENSASEYISVPECGTAPVKTSAEIELEFLSLIGGVANNLDASLAAAVQHYWSAPADPYPSMENCIEALLIDRFTQELLQARHKELLSDLEFIALHDHVQNLGSPHIRVATLKCLQGETVEAPLVGWYCLFTGSDEEKVFLDRKSVV